jgi:hypothetical protein
MSVRQRCENFIHKRPGISSCMPRALAQNSAVSRSPDLYFQATSLPKASADGDPHQRGFHTKRQFSTHILSVGRCGSPSIHASPLHSPQLQGPYRKVHNPSVFVIYAILKLITSRLNRSDTLIFLPCKPYLRGNSAFLLSRLLIHLLWLHL